MFTICLIVFWISLIGIVYTYVGYGLFITLLARWRTRPVKEKDITPTVTMLVAAYNEEDCIADKIENTLALDYPREKLELVVVTDGSTDRTNEIVASYAGQNVQLDYEPERRGKVGALIRAFRLVKGEIVVFSDANSTFQVGTLRKLVRHFADPEVGGVGGAKRMIDEGETVAGQGEGIYWQYESYLKTCDSAVSSVMGVPGEIWAARRSAYVPPDPDTMLDDFVASLSMVERGWRVLFERQALAYEEASPNLRAEWKRRSRNAAGGWQAFFKLPGMLHHKSKLVTFQYISHRLLRWMVTPELLVLLFFANIGLLTLGGRQTCSRFYAYTLVAQLAFYAISGLGWLLAARGRHLHWLLAPFYICMLNAAALAGGWRFLRGKQPVAWDKVR